MQPDHREYLEELCVEWLEKASKDHVVARLLFAHHEYCWDAAAYHCQQAAEKYLKAFLTIQERSFPRTHDLHVLGDLCAKVVPEWGRLLAMLEFMTEFAEETRYPGHGPPNELDIQVALDRLGQLRRVLQTTIPERIWPAIPSEEAPL